MNVCCSGSFDNSCTYLVERGCGRFSLYERAREVHELVCMCWDFIP